MNPGEYLNRSIHRGFFDETVRTILEKDDEDRCWQMYLAGVANPFTNLSEKSFNEFKQDCMDQTRQQVEAQESGVSDRKMKLQIDCANNILGGFVPPKKGG